VELLVDRPEILGRLPVGVGLAVEVVERLGAVRLGLEQVVGLQTEAAGELPEGGVALVISWPPRSTSCPSAKAPRRVQLRPPTRSEAS
jgi:hypothetical protein